MAELESEGKPNLTPMLDMVFQLITFFMLVINFKAASLDLNLKLPVVGSARPVDTKGQNRSLVLNIDKEGNLKAVRPARSRSRSSSSGRRSRLMRPAPQPDLQVGQDLPTTGGDSRGPGDAVPRLLNRVIRTCQENGFRQFALKADDQEEEGFGRS